MTAPRRRPRAVPSLAHLLLAAAPFPGAAAGVGLTGPVAMVVGHDGDAVTRFHPFSATAFAAVSLPEGADPVDAEICPLSDGRVVGAVSDFGAYVYVIDLETAAYTRVEVQAAALDVSCCGDFLIVTGGDSLSLAADARRRPPLRGGLDHPPLVVDLLAAKEVFRDPKLPKLLNAVASACAPDGSSVVVADREHGVLRLLELDARGQLVETGNERSIQDPTSLSVSPRGGCGTVVATAVAGEPDQAVGFSLPALAPTQPVAVTPSLAFVGSCSVPGFSFVRSPEALDFYVQDASCQLERRFAIETPGPVSSSLLADTVACAGDRLFVAVDGDPGGDPDPRGDAVRIYRQSDGFLLATLEDPSLDGPLGIAVYVPPVEALAIPVLSPGATAVLVVLVAASGLRALRSRRPAAASRS